MARTSIKNGIGFREGATFPEPPAIRLAQIVGAATATVIARGVVTAAPATSSTTLSLTAVVRSAYTITAMIIIGIMISRIVRSTTTAIATFVVINVMVSRIVSSTAALAKATLVVVNVMVGRIIRTAPLADVARRVVAAAALADMARRVIGTTARHCASSRQCCGTNGGGCYAQFPDSSHLVSPEWSRRGLPVFPQREQATFIPCAVKKNV